MVDYSNYSVFIFGAGGRQVLPVCEGFFSIGCKVICYCYSKWDTGYLTKYKSQRILFEEKISNGKDFLEYGVELIKKNKYSLVIPMSDSIASFLAKNKDELSKFSMIGVNDWSTFQYAIDKAKTMSVCMQNAIPAPKTFYGEDLLDQIKREKLEYPVVVKPRTGVGSIGFNIINSEEQLLDYLERYGNDNGPVLVQEYVKQGNSPQYRADLFRTRQGEYKAACVAKVTRWYPLDGGSGIYIESINDNVIIANCKKLLDTINWNGYANIDMVYDERSHTAKIIEINGRVGASIKIDYESGINVSQLILENEMGLLVTDMNSYKVGKRVSCFLPDLLWFFASKNRFKAKPSWFNRIGLKDTIFSWKDPIPTVGFFVQSFTGFLPAMKKRRRLKNSETNSN